MTKRNVIIGFLLTAGAFLAFSLTFYYLNGGIWGYILAIATILLALLAGRKYGSVASEAIKIIREKILNRLGYSKSADRIWSILSESQRQRINEAIKITFTGDLILLREGVERAYDQNSGQYDFHEMFCNVSHIWKSADLSIGVFEGPMGGNAHGYSNSNFDDGIKIALNFPDSFAQAIKDAGIGLVTVATNHLMDVGYDAAVRTIRKLDEIGLPFVGAYRDQDDYHRIKYVNIGGKKVAVLAYTYGLNYIGEDFFFRGKHRNLTRPLVAPGSRYFKQNKRLVEQDFSKAKAEGADMIIVLPHMGEQFRHMPDRNQLKWCDIFVEFGADIIFSDHTHAVQPIEWRKNKNGHNVLLVHCPGNFINSYTGHDGDASMIVSAYLDKNTLEPITASVTPIYAYCPQKGQWTGLPIYKALSDPHFMSQISRAEYRRIESVHKLVTKYAIDAPLGLDNIQPEYYTIPGIGYVRNSHIVDGKSQSVDIQHCAAESNILNSIRSVDSVCFVGDSITEGTKNGGYGWYEPLMAMFPEKRVYRFAKGAQTSKYFRENARLIAEINAGLYIMAFGCNDIRYRDSGICAMTAERYIENIAAMTTVVKEVNQSAVFIFIAPWMSMNFDANFKGRNHQEKIALYHSYTSALESYCKEHGFGFINPNPVIFNNIDTPDISINGYLPEDILVDFIHPNARQGITFYSNAVIKSSI